MKAEISLTQTLTFGPAMSALTERQRSFVVAWHNGGGKNGTEAARAAGYADNGGASIRNHANWLLQNPNVQAAIVEYARTRFVSDLPGTLDIINDIAYNPQHKDRLAAAKLKLHHAGMIEKTMVEHAGTVTVTFPGRWPFS